MTELIKKVIWTSCIFACLFFSKQNFVSFFFNFHLLPWLLPWLFYFLIYLFQLRFFFWILIRVSSVLNSWCFYFYLFFNMNLFLLVFLNTPHCGNIQKFSSSLQDKNEFILLLNFLNKMILKQLFQSLNN